MDNNDDDDNGIYSPELTAEENQIKFLFKTFFSILKEMMLRPFLALYPFFLFMEYFNFALSSSKTERLIKLFFIMMAITIKYSDIFMVYARLWLDDFISIERDMPDEYVPCVPILMEGVHRLRIRFEEFSYDTGNMNGMVLGAVFAIAMNNIAHVLFGI